MHDLRKAFSHLDAVFYAGPFLEQGQLFNRYFGSIVSYCTGLAAKEEVSSQWFNAFGVISVLLAENIVLA